jgi:UDPglucose 6-dehydrogenase
MKITVIGSGYVGLVSAACLAEVGNHVICLDLDAKKIEGLNQGIIPIHEPGLEELVKRNMFSGRIHFTTDIQMATEHGDIQFIAVGTPPSEDGSADLSYVLSAAENIARYMNRYTIVVNKSTVPVGTADKVYGVIESILLKHSQVIEFDVVSNPEFLKEGAAIEDFMRPDRVIVGTDSDKAYEIMAELYSAYAIKDENKVIRMDRRSSEITKYASNAMLANRISFMNQLSNLADKTGADIGSIRKGMGSDRRIGKDFLYAGSGYGGSCFPKDVQALIKTGEEYGVELPILKAVEAVNEQQKLVLTKKVIAHFGDISGMKFAIWGLAFKPNTDDMREAPSGPIIQELIRLGATVICYDPVAQKEAEKIYIHEPSVSFVQNPLGTLTDVDALIIATEWKEFRLPLWDAMKKLMKNPVIFDGRNIYHPEVPRKKGFAYFSIGRP